MINLGSGVVMENEKYEKCCSEIISVLKKYGDDLLVSKQIISSINLDKYSVLKPVK